MLTVTVPKRQTAQAPPQADAQSARSASEGVTCMTYLLIVQLPDALSLLVTIYRQEMEHKPALQFKPMSKPQPQAGITLVIRGMNLVIRGNN